MAREQQYSRDCGVLRFDGFELDSSSGELRSGPSRLVLQPQPFKVLELLAARSGCLVTREEIRRQLWSTGTFVDFEGGLNYCVRQIRKALGEDARKPRYIETLHRRGYRFLAPVSRIDEPTRTRFIPALSGCQVVSPCIRLAVLPFSDLSCSRNEAFLADGITELLITYLSANSSLRVVSRTTIMQYKNSGKSLCRIGRELGVDRVLEGAVLHSGMRARITARLIDTSTDKNEWAACYEAEMQDHLILQEHIAHAVACDTAMYLMPTLKGSAPAGLRSSAPSPLKSSGQVWALPHRTIPACHPGKSPALVPGLVLVNGRHTQRASGASHRLGI